MHVTTRTKVDVLMLIVLMVATLVTTFAVMPFERGFFCDDRSIRHPYKDNTVSPTVVVIVSIICPLLTIYCLKCDRNYQFCSKSHWWQFVQQTFPFWFGLFVNAFIMQITKISIGRLRPNFIDVCRLVATINGSQYYFYNVSHCEEIHNVYITPFECTAGHDLNALFDMVTQVHLSFFSGHASLTTHAAIFICFLLEDKMRSRNLLSLKLTLQVALVMFAAWVGFTRVNDHWHHYQDVFIGYTIGAATAIGFRSAFAEATRRDSLRGKETVDGADNISM